MQRSTFIRAAAGALAAGSLGIRTASAQTYPSRTVRIVVPTPPGGPSDLVARTWSQALAPQWKSGFVVDNKPGGSQVIGTQAVSSAPPDGYTVLQAASSMATMPLVVEHLPFDVARDFVAVSFTHLTPLVVVVDPRLPIHSMAELIAYARDKPGVLSFGHTGEGSSQQLATRLLAQTADLRGLVEIPYKGSSQAHPDLIAGRLSVMIDPVSAVSAHIRSGAVRAIAVTTAARIAALPDVPTAIESGVAGFDVSSWGGVFAPAGTPQPIVDRLNQALRDALGRKDIVQQFAGWGLIAKAGPAAEFDAFVKAEMVRWRAVMLAPRT